VARTKIPCGLWVPRPRFLRAGLLTCS
jgi:hypothetical protein